MQLQNCMEKQRLKEANQTVETVEIHVHANTNWWYGETERFMETKEIRETVETNGDAHKYNVFIIGID